MKEGPNIAALGALIGDPARANMLTALMSGTALTASELATEAGVTLQTASAHLGKLEAGGLLRQRKQGRHRYYSLSGTDVSSVLENLMGLAARTGHTRVRTGPQDPKLRKARSCYDHLAGEYGVRMLDSLTARGLIAGSVEEPDLTADGIVLCTSFGIDLARLRKSRRPLCKLCLDWSARRSHLAGGLGTAFLERFFELGWARREHASRAITFVRKGETEFLALFPV